MDEEYFDEEPPKEVDLSLVDAKLLADESKELLKNLYSLSDAQARRIITQDDLRNDVSLFVCSQLKNLENQNILKGLLEAEIAKKVLAHDLSTDEIFKAYGLISSEKARNIDSLFRLFVPTQATPNTILTPATKDEERETVELTPSQRQALEKLTRIIQNSPNNNVENKAE